MEFPGCPQGAQFSPGGAVVSARLCRLPEQELHQPSSTRTNITILPQNTQNPQNLLADKSLPQIAQINTD